MSFGNMDFKERVFWKDVGNKIKIARENSSKRSFSDMRTKSFSQGKLAQMLNVSRATIANIEGGRQRITLYNWHQIIQILPELKDMHE